MPDGESPAAITITESERMQLLGVVTLARQHQAGLAAELIAELVVAGQEAAAVGSDLGITGGREFAAEIEAAIAAEQNRRGLSRG